MSLFQRNELPSIEKENIPPANNGLANLEKKEEADTPQIAHGRWWLGVVYGAAMALLFVWGYVILPSEGWLTLLWWPLAITASSLGGWLIWRQVRGTSQEQQRQQEQEQAAQRPTLHPSLLAANIFYGLVRRLPLGLVPVLLVGYFLNSWIVTANPQPLRHDSFEYSQLAYNYSREGYTAHAVRTPGYTVLLAGIFKLGDLPPPDKDQIFGPRSAYEPNYWAQEAWRYQRIMLLAVAVLTYLLVAELRAGQAKRWRIRLVYLGDPVGLLAALLVATCPFLIAYTGVPMTETATTLWLMLAVYLWVKTLKYSGIWAYPILLGVALSLLLQTRPTFIYLPILVGATFWLASRKSPKTFFLNLLLMAVPIVLFSWPQLAANVKTFDEPSPLIAADFSTHQTALGIYLISTGGLPRYQIVPSAHTYNPVYEPIWDRLRGYLPVQMGTLEGRPLSNAERKKLGKIESDFFKQHFSDYVTSQPLEYAGTMAKRMWFMWNQHFLFPYYDPSYWDYRWLTDNLNRLYLVAGLLGVFVAVARWRWHALPLWLVLVYMLGVHALVVIEFRYALPVYPVLLVFGALGLSEIGQAVRGQLKGRARWRTLAGAGMALAFVATLALTVPLIPPTSPARERALDVLAQAQEYNEVRQFRQAQELYNQAIEMYPGEAQLWAGRANYFAGGRRPTQALPDYDKAIALDPAQPDPYRWRGDTLAELKRGVEARRDFQKFLELAPANHPSRPKVQRELERIAEL